MISAQTLIFILFVTVPVTVLAQEVLSLDEVNNVLTLEKVYQHTVTLKPKSMEELVVTKGYPLIKYHVVTEDGYILGLFRIPNGKDGTTSSPRGPLILQHGILTSSSCFVLSSTEKGLGFILADAGFDVWLPNTRGNFYSRKHMTVDHVKDPEVFYNFSFHEMGYYDLPAVIDFILNNTNFSQLYYVGHSQGSTNFLVLTSTRPEYNKKIKAAALMAPAAIFGNEKGPAKIFADFTKELEWLTKKLGSYVVFNDTPLTKLVDKTICLTSGFGEKLCKDILFSFFGPTGKSQFNSTLIPMVLEQGAAGGASVKQFVHFGQLSMNDHKFSMFDYGRQENLKRYGDAIPPQYNLSQITVPIVFHYAQNDWLVAPENVIKLSQQIPTSSLVEIPFPSFSHLDFLWAIDVKELVYDKMIAILQNTQATIPQ